MAESRKTSAKLEELVPVKLFKDDNRYNDDVFVGVNGRTWQIKRGVEVMVPPAVAEVLKNAQEQREKASMNTDKLEAEFLASSRYHGFNI